MPLQNHKVRPSFKVTVLFCIPTNNTRIYYCCLLAILTVKKWLLILVCISLWHMTAFFHMPICCLCIFFGVACSNVFGPFFKIGLFSYWVLTIPFIIILYQVSFANIFSACGICPFILLTLSLAEQNFPILIKFSLLFLPWIILLVL